MFPSHISVLEKFPYFCAREISIFPCNSTVVQSLGLLVITPVALFCPSFSPVSPEPALPCWQTQPRGPLFAPSPSIPHPCGHISTCCKFPVPARQAVSSSTQRAAWWDSHLDLPTSDTSCPPPTLPGSRGVLDGIWMEPSPPHGLDLGGRSHEMAPSVWRKANLHLDVLGARTWPGGQAEGDLQGRREKEREQRRWEEREGELQALLLS